jgi:hypothetical protein
MGNTQCSSIVALDAVKKLCQNKTACSIAIKSASFGQDPCVGTNKYAQFSHTCGLNGSVVKSDNSKSLKIKLIFMHAISIQKFQK